MTRELCSEGWAVDKLQMVNQIRPQHRKWTPEVIGTIDRDKYDGTVIDPYDHEPLYIVWRTYSYDSFLDPSDSVVPDQEDKGISHDGASIVLE